MLEKVLRRALRALLDKSGRSKETARALVGEIEHALLDGGASFADCGDFWAALAVAAEGNAVVCRVAASHGSNAEVAAMFGPGSEVSDALIEINSVLENVPVGDRWPFVKVELEARGLGGLADSLADEWARVSMQGAVDR